MDSNHDLRIQRPAFSRLNYGSFAGSSAPGTTLREKDSNLQPPGSEPGVLPIELSLTEIDLTGSRLDSNQQPEAYEASALPLSYAPEFRFAHRQGRKLESNQRLPLYENGALPAELLRHSFRSMQ